MKLSSNDIGNGMDFPKELSCDGSGENPELHWSDAPAATKSFAIVVSDPDAPMGTYYHWLVCNIPASISGIPRGATPSGAKLLANTSGSTDYVAPCPPSGTHRYYFTVYALDVEKMDCGSKQEFLEQIARHKIAEATILTPFKRK